jgi:hypothetical protein
MPIYGRIAWYLSEWGAASATQKLQPARGDQERGESSPLASLFFVLMQYALFRVIEGCLIMSKEASNLLQNFTGRSILFDLFNFFIDLDDLDCYSARYSNFKPACNY